MSHLQARQLIPNFVLTDSNDREFRSAAFRGWSNLVIVFPDGDPRLIDEFKGRNAEFEEENARVIFVVDERFRPDRQASFPVLIDRSGEVIAKYGVQSGPAIFITDQYGEIYSAHRSGDGDTLPDADEILASLRHVNAACPE